jgi:ABC-2 type transport system ATP-binding protein
VGFVLQQSKPDPYLTVREALTLFAGYYPSPRAVPETIELIGLGAKADTRAQHLSGGQQRRLDVGLALIGDPELLFLDEPTTGFDPTARRRFWKMIGDLGDLGKTVFLTTHYMEEAQFLADRAAIIVRGEVIATGRPDELGRHTGADTEVRFRIPEGIDRSELPVATQPEGEDGTVTIRTGEPLQTLNDLTGWALRRGVDLVGLEVGRPSLEEVYLRLTAGADTEDE